MLQEDDQPEGLSNEAGDKYGRAATKDEPQE